jgi:hypothetical protein
MKTAKFTIPVLILSVSLLLVFPHTSFSEEKKPVLTVKNNCVEGVVIKFDDRKRDFGKEEAVDLPILPFNKDDYEISDPERLDTIAKDGFGYPRACTVFDKMAEDDKGKK